MLPAAVERLQERFLTTGQALLHGSFHTGSVMIDGEFETFGPADFDLDMFAANLVFNA